MLQILTAFLFVVHAAETPESDRVQMREALRRCLVGTYTCNMEMALNSVAAERRMDRSFSRTIGQTSGSGISGSNGSISAS